MQIMVWDFTYLPSGRSAGTAVILCGMMYVGWTVVENFSGGSINYPFDPRNKITESVPHIAIVICGDRKLNETLNLIKTLLIFNDHSYIHIFADQSAISEVSKRLLQVTSHRNLGHKIFIRHAEYPRNVNAVIWRTIYRPCATLKLFIPFLLPVNITSALYLDTDTLTFGSLDEVWREFWSWNTSVAISGAQAKCGKWKQNPAVPGWGKSGVNTGVILMNLTRMRNNGWMEELLAIHKEYQRKLTLGDQDLFDVYTWRHPERLRVLPCNLNFRHALCVARDSCCKDFDLTSPVIIHGVKSGFHKHAVFKAIYYVVHNMSFGLAMETDTRITMQLFAKDLAQKLKQLPPSPCVDFATRLTGGSTNWARGNKDNDP